MTAELARVIRSKYDSEYSPELQFRPSMRCGSLVMQAVVGDTIASQLREHYSSAGNELKLEVGGQPLLFAPPVTTTPSSTTKTTTAAAAATTKLRTATSNQPAMVTLIDEKRSNPDQDDEQYFVMGLSLTVTLGVVIALTSIVVICVTQCGSRANQYKSKDGAGGDEDAEVHVVSAENQEKVMSDDPYEVNVEMRTMVASKINSNKEDEDVAEPEHEPESEPKAEAPTTEDSQKAACETTVDINV